MKSMLKLEQLHPRHTRHFVKNLVSAVWVLLIIFAIFPLALSGQSLAGELRLTVEDPSGRVMQASGKLVNVSNGKSRTFQTDAQGAYTFKNLSYGHYKLEVSRKGFSVQTSEIEVEGETPVMC